MRRIHDSVLRRSVIALLAVSGLAVSGVANAACSTFWRNTCYGVDVLLSNTTGQANSGFGYAVLRSNTIGSYNTANGAIALYYNTTGSGNTASGYAALRTNTTGYNNTASGYAALLSNTTGFYNSASGSIALYDNTTGGYNTASGYAALRSNTTGVYNSASGAKALYYNTTGSGNTASGGDALLRNTTGVSNTASGYAALNSNTTGAGNTASGYGALKYNTTGDYNTADGTNSLYSTSSGFRNVAVGWAAGSSVTGSDNIVIGANNKGVVAENGVIRIGTSAYQKRAFIAGIRGVKTGATGAVAVLIDANGQLGTINSSRRFKQDIQPMGSVSERLFALRPVTFRYRQAYEDGSKPVQYGLVAEEVAAVFPELVVYGKDDKPETVAYHVLATLLLNELQKDHQVIQMQAEQLAELRRDNEAQVARTAALEQQVAMLAKAVEQADKSRMLASTR